MHCFGEKGHRVPEDDELDNPFVRVMGIHLLPNPTFWRVIVILAFWCLVHEDQPLLHVLHPTPGNIYWLPLNSEKHRMEIEGHCPYKVWSRRQRSRYWIPSWRSTTDLYCRKNHVQPRLSRFDRHVFLFVIPFVDLTLNKPIPNRGRSHSSFGLVQNPSSSCSNFFVENRLSKADYPRSGW